MTGTAASGVPEAVAVAYTKSAKAPKVKEADLLAGIARPREFGLLTETETAPIIRELKEAVAWPLTVVTVKD